MTRHPRVLWRLTDGKPGHEKQSLGLANAIARIMPARLHDIRIGGGPAELVNWLSGRFPAGAALPDPDLLLGAGHGTHVPLLAARRARGGRIVVLMKPSLPLRLFDLCLIPEHDEPPERTNVIRTRGALNAVVPSREHDPGRGLILIGGPSRHFRWNDGEIAGQVRQLVARTPHIHWTLSTSRRTPEPFLDRLAGLELECLPAAATPPFWLEARLATVGHAWITPDSVAMVYEALTAGCRVGLFELPPVAASRVAAGVGKLRSAHLVTSLRPQPGDPEPAMLEASIDEASRCARLIKHRWFPEDN